MPKPTHRHQAQLLIILQHQRQNFAQRMNLLFIDHRVFQWMGHVVYSEGQQMHSFGVLCQGETA